MVNSINSNLNTIQFFNATNAFKNINSVKTIEAPQETKTQDATEEKTFLNDNDILNNINMDEIKEYASKIGENNINEDDIKYGLTYGRSILADWVV